MHRAYINRSGCNISITETPIKIVQWLLGQAVTPNKKPKQWWSGGGRNNTGRMSVKRTNSKKQTQADICIGHGWHTHMHIYLYEYVRAARKCSHTRMGSHILISFNLAHIQCRTVTRLVIGIVCLNACPLSGNGHGCHPHPSFHHGHRKCGMDTSWMQARKRGCWSPENA